ncbi:uncharacterized protein LOC131172119 [Hevea brasiliensis]|uniref:uncharacterized protein LOC131172119 n=1 Tax=Hevea brasiliensis TaxID=3981 RepID=UPI0025F0C3F1|nr:uncharacterized protein LOC131172119 [Hevea brasiliensis]
MGCSSARMVLLARNQLKGVAREWYLSKKNGRLEAPLRLPKCEEVVDQARQMEMYDDEHWAHEQRKRVKKDGQGNQFNRGQSHQGSYQGNARYSQISTGSISTPCQHCGKLHKDTCYWVTRACFGCGQLGHCRQDCSTSGTTQGAGQAAHFVPSQVQPVSQYSGGIQGSDGRGQGGRGSTQT